MNTEFKKRLAVVLSILPLVVFFLSCDEKGEWEGNAPEKVFLTRITLSDYPETKQGSNTSWDIDSPPDISLFIQDETEELVTYVAETDTIIDAIPDTSYIFDFFPPVEILNPEVAHRVQIHDIDYTILKYETMYDYTGLTFFTLHSRSPFYSDTIITNSYNLSSESFNVRFDVLYEY